MMLPLLRLSMLSKLIEDIDYESRSSKICLAPARAKNLYTNSRGA
jgi:hypothetical protein